MAVLTGAAAEKIPLPDPMNNAQMYSKPVSQLVLLPCNRTLARCLISTQP